MKKVTLKNTLFYLGMSVLTGVMLLGISVASGATPVDPAPGLNVKPTFNGMVLDISGDTGTDKLLIGGNAGVEWKSPDEIPELGDSHWKQVESAIVDPYVTTDTEDIPVVIGTALGLFENAKAALDVRGNADIEGNLNAGSITATGPISNENVEFNNASNTIMKVKGDEAIWYNGNHFSWGFDAIYNYFANKIVVGNALSTPANNGIVLEVNGDARIRGGHIRDNAGISRIGFEDDITRIRDSSSNSQIGVTSNGFVGIGTISPEAQLDVSGGAKIDGQLELENGLVMSGDGTLALSILDYATQVHKNLYASDGLKVSGLLEAEDDVDVGADLDVGDTLDVGGNALVRGDLSIWGDVRILGELGYNKYTRDGTNVTANNSSTSIIGCNAGDLLLACGFESKDPKVYATYIQPTVNGCAVRGWDDDGSDGVDQIDARVSCLDL